MAAAGAVALPVAPDLCMAGIPTRDTALYTIVYDRRIAASAAFGKTAQSAGFSTYAMDGDITELWTSDLADRWRDEPVAIAGMTGHGPLFCLERFGWDHRMRVVFRARHSRRSDSIEHALWGPPAMLGASGDLLASRGPNFGEPMAHVVGLYAPHRETMSAVTIVAPVPDRSENAETLFSWVIAPCRTQDRKLNI